MIILHAARDCSACGTIEDELTRLSIAHRVDRVGESADAAHTLEDDGETWSGHDAMSDRVDELERFAEQWRRFQSDACYCVDEDLGGDTTSG